MHQRDGRSDAHAPGVVPGLELLGGLGRPSRGAGLEPRAIDERADVMTTRDLTPPVERAEDEVQPSGPDALDTRGYLDGGADRRWLEVRELDRLTVYGREGGLAIYELLGIAGAANPPGWAALYERGLAAYRARDFAGAANLFQQVLAARPADELARILLARCREARVAVPGGDDFGPRPIDVHLRGLEALGATFTTVHGYVHARAEHLLGTRILLEFPSVERARAWYESDAYRDAKALRQRTSKGSLLLVEGV